MTAGFATIIYKAGESFAADIISSLRSMKYGFDDVFPLEEDYQYKPGDKYTDDKLTELLKTSGKSSFEFRVSIYCVESLCVFILAPRIYL